MSEFQDSLDEALRAHLRPDAAPTSLRDGLLSEARRGHRSSWPRARRWMIAAAFLLLCLPGMRYAVRSAETHQRRRIIQAALLESIRPDSSKFQGEASCPGPVEDACLSWSRNALGFDAPVPSALTNCPLRGRGVCEICGMPAACYTLEDGRVVFVLQKPIPGLGESPERVRATDGTREAHAWNESGRGVVAVHTTEKF